MNTPTETCERDDRDPTYWRTNQTALTEELSQHGPDCRCERCTGEDPVESYVDEVLKPLYDKISELTQENAKLREALRKLREPMRERAVEEATDGSDNTLSVQLSDAGYGSQGIV